MKNVVYTAARENVKMESLEKYLRRLEDEPCGSRVRDTKDLRPTTSQLKKILADYEGV